MRLYSLQASGLSTYDCSAQIEVHNRMEVVLTGFAALIRFFDAFGTEIARKPFEMTRIRPNARRREGLGFKFATASQYAPRDMTELVEQCDVIASGEIALRACEAENAAIFAECQTRLVAHEQSEIPIVIRRDAVAEEVDYGVVAMPEGFRAEIGEAADIADLGLRVTTITAELAWAEGLSPAVQGLLVLAVNADGPALRAGVQVGDVLSEVDQDVVLAPSQILGAVSTARTQDRRSVLLLLDRGGDLVFAVVALAPAP